MCEVMRVICYLQRYANGMVQLNICVPLVVNCSYITILFCSPVLTGVWSENMCNSIPTIILEKCSTFLPVYHGVTLVYSIMFLFFHCYTNQYQILCNAACGYIKYIACVSTQMSNCYQNMREFLHLCKGVYYIKTLENQISSIQLILLQENLSCLML